MAAWYGAALRGRGVLVSVIFLGVLSTSTPSGADPDEGEGNGNADQLELTGIVRDFLPSHPDFDLVPPEGYGQYMWNIATALGGQLKPSFVGGGYKVLSHAYDIDGRPICWALYNPDLGDTPAEQDGPDSGSITSAATFDQWFRDVLGTNMSTLISVTGTWQDDGEHAGMYEINIPQFYPIDDMLLGNDGPHNNFFTFEIVASFVHDSTANYQLLFISDDDAWIFLEGEMIADLGGINGSSEQWVDLNRLGLVDGETYRVRLFKADRSDASSRFHLVTNIPLTSEPGGTILAAFD